MAILKSKEFKVGVMALSAGLALYFGISFLKGTDFLSTQRKYFAIYNEVDGLTISNPVMLNGFVVGLVQKISLIPGEKYRILTTLEVNSDVQITDSTIAVLASNGLIGGKAIMLQIRPGGEPMRNRDTLRTQMEQSMISQVAAQTAPLIANLDSMAIELKMLLRGMQGTTKKLDATLDNTGQMTQNANALVAENRPALRAMMGNAASLSRDLQRTQQSLGSILNKFDNVADSLEKARIAQTINNLNETVASLGQVMNGIERGQGSIGKLVNNDSLYNNLNKSSESLDALLRDFQQRPKRYVHFSVFGRKNN